jgi:hypothetical protein
MPFTSLRRLLSTAILSLAGSGFLPAQFLVGEQDFPDLAILANSNSAWLAAQANEPAPMNVIWTSPATITWQHAGVPTGVDALLTIGLWDLDNGAAGRQVSAVTWNGVAQGVSVLDVFENLATVDLQYRLFRIPVPAADLVSGTLQVSLTFGSPSGNEVGFDFALLEPNAGFVTFGAGCPGSLGVPIQVATALPQLGQTAALTTTGLPADACFHMLGFSRTSSGFGPLPIDLSSFGAPGCFGRVGPEFTVFLVGSGGSATRSFWIPNVSFFLGAQLFAQSMVLDPGVNALDAVFSNAASVVLGI